MIMLPFIKNVGRGLQPPSNLDQDRAIMIQCRRWGSNPHEHKAHYALNVARLPVPPLRREAILTNGGALSMSLFECRAGFYTRLLG